MCVPSIHLRAVLFMHVIWSKLPVHSKLLINKTAEEPLLVRQMEERRLLALSADHWWCWDILFTYGYIMVIPQSGEENDQRINVSCTRELASQSVGVQKCCLLHLGIDVVAMTSRGGSCLSQICIYWGDALSIIPVIVLSDMDAQLLDFLGPFLIAG